MTTTITADAAIEALRAEVAEEGREFIYPVPTSVGVCSYVRHGQPDCLVARALHRIGIPVEALTRCEGIAAHMLHRTYITGIFEQHGFVVSEEAAMVFSAAQQVQDQRLPWGEALDAAEAKYIDVTTREAQA